MENSPATGQDEGRLPGVGAKGPLGPGRAVDGRQLGEQMPGFLPRLLSRGVGLEGGATLLPGLAEGAGPQPKPWHSSCQGSAIDCCWGWKDRDEKVYQFPQAAVTKCLDWVASITGIYSLLAPCWPP